MKILLLSAYDAESHKRWRTGLVNNLSEHEWVTLTLPPRYFAWRIRGNGLSWGVSQRDTFCQPWDLIVATSMVDLATLKGLVPEIARVPTVLYFHENQFAYPSTRRQFSSLEPQMVNLYAALAADVLVFNSDYNRNTFLEGVEELLAKMPDAVPQGVAGKLNRKANTLAVPLEASAFTAREQRQERGQGLHILWNHRWEYDKGPARLLEAICAMPESLKLTCHVVGQQFRQRPPEFEKLRELLIVRGWLGQFGYIEDAQVYRQLLRSSDVVLSTALHDFQGLSVLEAVAAGCVPVVPNRLAYQELFADRYRYLSCSGDGSAEPVEATLSESAACAAMITHYAQHGLPIAPSVSNLSWSSLGPLYRRLIQQ